MAVLHATSQVRSAAAVAAAMAAVARALTKEQARLERIRAADWSNRIASWLSKPGMGAAHRWAAREQAIFAFDLQLEELLDMQFNRVMVKDQGKVKLDVNKTLVFLNERMRF